MKENEDSACFRHVNEDMLVANIKRHLMSRDDKMKIEAVQFLFIYLESKSSRNDSTSQNACDRFIEADIVEYLGESMATQNALLLREIFRCLELFLGSEKFSTQLRAAYIIECLQRTLYFLFKHSDMELSATSDGLRLLAIFIEEFNKTLSLTQLFGNDANMSQVICFVLSLLKNKEELGDEIAINASLVLFSLLSQNDLTLLGCEFLCKMPDAIQRSLASLAILCNSKHLQGMHTKIMTLMAKIGHGALRFCQGLTSEHQDRDCYESENEVTQPERETESQTQKPKMKMKASKRIVSCVVSFTQNMWLPYLMKLELGNESCELCFSVLQCIRYLYQVESFDINNFSEDLAKRGFTIFLPFVLNWVTERQFQDFRVLIQRVMIEYITNLCEEYLGTSMWLQGFDLKLYFEEGTCLLPARFCDWLNVLSEQNVPESSKHFVIIFFYFFCLFLPSLPSHELQLKCLLNYISSVSMTPCPVPVLKAIWFLYTEAILCQTSVPPVEIIYNSTDVLLKCLENAPCAQLYTHHPAILFWSFSSPRIPTNFQYEVMCLWLEREDNGCYDAALVKMALTSEDVIFCLLEVLKHGKRELACHTASVLRKTIVCQKEKASVGILSLLWDTLPSVIAEYCAGSFHMTGHNITYYMDAACTGFPSTPASKVLLQCSTHAMKILTHFEKAKDASIESKGSAVQIALMSLLMAMKKRDLRVLLSYVNQLEFIKMIYHSSGHRSVKLIRPCLQLLMHINKYYQETFIDSQKKGFTLHIDILHILYLLVQEDYDVLVCTLHFLYDVITSELPKPILVIVTAEIDYISLPFLQLLFRHLQNICSKNIPRVSRSSFKAMGAILQYAFKMHPENELYSNLATHPWTHVVLRIYFMSKKPDLNCELLFFLCWWFHFYVLRASTQIEFHSSNIRARRKTRAPYPDLLSETTNQVARALTDAEQLKSSQTNRLALTVMHRILLLNASISQEKIQALRSTLIEANFEVPAKGPHIF